MTSTPELQAQAEAKRKQLEQFEAEQRFEKAWKKVGPLSKIKSTLKSVELYTIPAWAGLVKIVQEPLPEDEDQPDPLPYGFRLTEYSQSMNGNGELTEPLPEYPGQRRAIAAALGVPLPSKRSQLSYHEQLNTSKYSPAECRANGSR